MKQKKSKHGFVLRQVVLKNVSGQMVSASARVDAGLPTAMAVSSLICIGTSHGVVLVFDPQQTLKLVLGNTSIGAEYGAVTALGINMECTRVLCGHARGQITMWDLQTGKLLRSIPDAHPQGSAVLHVVFTDDPSVAICSDSGGSVFVLTFKRLIGVRSYESTCLFSGCRGEVCTMAPLHLHEGMKDHPLYEQSLLALATLTKVHFDFLLRWLNPQVIAAVDTLERVHVMDVRSMEELEVKRTLYRRGVAASEHSCYQTIRVFNGQLLLLGVKSVHVLTLRSWQDRIEVFVKQNNFLDALELALSFYNGTAMAVVGLSGNKEQKTAEIAAQIEELLLAFVDITVFVSCPKTRDVEELKTYFKSPIVMKEFIEHYQQQNKLREVESCLMHLDVTNLDIHQMVKLCWAHGLFDAIFYVYNRGMHDYTTPLEDLINVLKNTVQSGQLVLGSDLSLGNKLLVYISCCLAGQGYPVGSIPEDLAQEVKRKIFNCITARSTKDDSETELSYPRLRVLLQFDTQEFLNVLSMVCFFLDIRLNIPNGVTRRQYLVNILLDVMVQDTGFSPSQVGSLFTFLARQMAKKENRLQVNKILFEQVLEYLSNPDDDSRHEERQQALLELWNAGGLQQFDDARILVLAENAKFYRVCEMLYEKKRQFPKVLSCYFRDSYRAHQVFAYVHYVMTEDVYTELEREELKEASLNSLQSFLSIDCGKTANMIVTEFPDALTVVVRQLEGQSATQFEFLKGVFENNIKDPTYNTGKFGEIKELILGMLDTYSYESTLLKTTNKLLAGDLHSSLSHLKRQSVHGFIPKSFRCAICHRVFIEEFDSGQRDDLIVYRCGHVYHSECMAGTSGAEGNWICLLCNKTGLSRLSSGKGKTPLGKLAKPSPVAAKKYESAGASSKEPSQKTEKDIASLTQQQFEAIARLKTQSKGASRFAILSELSKPGDAFSLVSAMVRAPINQAAYLKTKDFACIWLLLVNNRCLLSKIPFKTFLFFRYFYCL
ncbi:PREDICTED: vacuolar protein sorting-associated protein 8 homolog [Acropora digitifera]|uniref:vacuolar protein sorting-associated protein 8 homolog n=1 Tax=Acropora digitifera TaxID=70779 RepID=UPI00077B0510|nr:PREDICTED: vacuolar protein sorting-associated protein 8 homolog [Acropora digitifera]